MKSTPSVRVFLHTACQTAQTQQGAPLMHRATQRCCHFVAPACAEPHMQAWCATHETCSAALSLRSRSAVMRARSPMMPSIAAREKSAAGTQDHIEVQLADDAVKHAARAVLTRHHFFFTLIWSAWPELRTLEQQPLAARLSGLAAVSQLGVAAQQPPATISAEPGPCCKIGPPVR